MKLYQMSSAFDCKHVVCLHLHPTCLISSKQRFIHCTVSTPEPPEIASVYPMPIKHVHELDFQCKANKAKAMLTSMLTSMSTAALTLTLTLPLAVIGNNSAAAAITLTRFLKLQQLLSSTSTSSQSCQLVQHFKRGCQTGFWLPVSLSWTRDNKRET